MKLKTIKSRIKPIQGTRALSTPTPEVERKRGSAGVKDRNAIKARDFGLCQECKRHGRVRPGAVVDHIKPLWAGGSDAGSNKQLLCHPCHDAKTKDEAGQRASGYAL